MDGYVEVALFVYIHMYTIVCIYLYMSPYRYVFQISTKCWETFRANVCAYVRRDFVHILALGVIVFSVVFRFEVHALGAKSGRSRAQPNAAESGVRRIEFAEQ